MVVSKQRALHWLLNEKRKTHANKGRRVLQLVLFGNGGAQLFHHRGEDLAEGARFA